MDRGAESYRRYLSGEDQGLAEIVATYKDGLIFYINGYVKNLWLAEELAEDTFFRLVVRRPRFSGKSTFKTFLYAIGRNVAVDHLRRSARHPDVSLQEAEKFCIDQSAEQQYFGQEQKRRLHQILWQLPPDYRVACWLIYFEDFSNREAARILKKTDRQMKNLLYRAKGRLRAALEKEGIGLEEL